MDGIGKEEGENMEEVEENRSLSQTHVHARLEEGQEPNPNPVDDVELETQESIDNNGVELPSDIQGRVDSAPNEPHAVTESDKLVSNVDSGVSSESEVSRKIESEENGGEKGEALKVDMGSEVNSSIELCGSDESDNVCDGGYHHTEVPMEIEKVDDGVKEEEAIKDDMGSKVDASIDLRTSAVTGNRVGDGGSHHTEVPMEIEKEDDGVEEGKALKDGVSSKAKAKPSNEQDISAETDNVVCKMELDMPCDSEVAKDKLIDGPSSEANPSRETRIGAETDSVVSKVESGMASDGEVATEKLIDGVSNKAKFSNEPGSSAETDNLVCKMELDMPHVSEVAMEKLIDGASSEAVPSSETHISTETDNVISDVDPGMPGDSEAATEKLIDGVRNKAKSSDEPDSSAETDNVVSKVEPDMSRDSRVATEKLIDAVSSEANPSSEPFISAETVNAVCTVELDTPHDSKVAMEKMILGLSSKANPSNELHMSAETDSIVREVEPDKVPSDSVIAMEKLTNRLNSKPNPSSEPRISAETDSVVSKVEPTVAHDNKVEKDTGSDDDVEKGDALKGRVSSKTMLSLSTDINDHGPKPKFYVGRKVGMKSLDPKPSFLLDPGASEDDGSGTEEEQAAFMKEVQNLYKEKNLEFKVPKFYKEGLNLLKLWRAVIKLGGYEKVTSCKLWRQVGESFNPPKTCTTVSWTFRNFYEKALLEFEKHRLHGVELALPVEPTRVENRAGGSQTLGSGRALRDAAARAMQGWHSQRHLGNGEVGVAIIKDKHLSTMPKSDKQLRSSGLLKRKKPSHGDYAVQVADMKAIKPRLGIMVFDIGPPADWVKINVKRFNDCFEVYALVPGLLREEVHVQTDPAGRLIISGQPRQLDNPWGVTPFKKVVSLPLRIDPQQTSAVVTLNGQLFMRVPFELSDF